jgi:putative membrane-bound dehydrogenase-like protein
MRFIHSSFCLLVFIVTISGCKNKTAEHIKVDTGLRPVEPENALATFELEPGFKIEMIASEPLVSDPVDMEIDEYGRLYVAEMHGYPLDISGTGKIKLLSDTDGDGKMDSMVVFADGLTLPNSVMRWKKGILVTDAPYVLYLEDSNNDGRADIRDTVLTGFALSNPQHNVSNPLYGLDNWIYPGHEGAITTHRFEKEFGDQGGEIYYPAAPDSPRLAKNGFGRTVRFQPGKHTLETTSSATQFGHTFDAYGHHFEQLYFNHIYQEILAAKYFDRNPALLLSDATEPISDHLDISEIFAITQQTGTRKPTSVEMTSVCGITTYLGGASHIIRQHGLYCRSGKSYCSCRPPHQPRCNLYCQPVAR